MYKIRNKVYADAGHILVGNKKQGYVLFGELDDFCEKEISINDMRIENNLLIYGENNIKERYDPALTYEQLKTKYIKKIFSNDDQIALILNKDKSPEDLELFNKMQEWRD
jgi:hypothetical protein